jgi:hypothetical protein
MLTVQDNSYNIKTAEHYIGVIAVRVVGHTLGALCWVFEPTATLSDMYEDPARCFGGIPTPEGPRAAEP